MAKSVGTLTHGARVVLAALNVFYNPLKSIHSQSVKMGKGCDVSPKNKREIELCQKILQWNYMELQLHVTFHCNGGMWNCSWL